MIIPLPLLAVATVIAFVAACLTSGPGRNTGNRWGNTQQMPQAGHMPYGAPTMRRSSSFLTNVARLILIVGILGAALAIYAPGVLHMLLRLCGLS